MPTLFTAMTELKGFEEKAGRDARSGIAPQRCSKDRETWAERRGEAAELGVTRQPYCLVIGGGQGGIGWARG